MNVLLTSSGLHGPVQSWAEQAVAGRKPRQAHIVVTASRDKQNNQWAQLARTQLLAMGIPKVDFFDYETQPASQLENTQLLYVNGGNTFKLMHHMEQQHAHQFINTFLKKGGLYMGVSAGSCVMGRAIDHLEKVGMDPDEVGFGARPALGFVPYRILPHDDANFGPKMQALQQPDALYLPDGAALVWNSITAQVSQTIGPVRGIAPVAAVAAVATKPPQP